MTDPLFHVSAVIVNTPAFSSASYLAILSDGFMLAYQNWNDLPAQVQDFITSRNDDKHYLLLTSTPEYRTGIITRQALGVVRVGGGSVG